MAKWWDERANHMRKLNEERRASYPAPASVGAPSPQASYRDYYDEISRARVSEIREQILKRDEAFWRQYHIDPAPQDSIQAINEVWINAGAATGRAVSAAEIWSTSRRTFETFTSPRLAKIFNDDDYPDAMPFIETRPVKEAGETDWDALHDMHPRMVIGRRLASGTRYEYVHMKGRISRLNTLRVLARYWNTAAKVAMLFGKGEIDILHPREEHCKWEAMIRPSVLESQAWESGTKSAAIVMWRDGNWHVRDGLVKEWVVLDPDTLA